MSNRTWILKHTVNMDSIYYQGTFLAEHFKVLSYLSVCKNFPKCPTKSPEKSRELMDTCS